MKDSSNIRSRSWFLTINQNAECYSNFLEIINLNLAKTKYAYILHNCDFESEPHYHLILLYKDGRYFNTIFKEFKGAHIEKINDLTKTVQYLTHKNDSDKYQYSFEEIKSNELNYFKMLYDNESSFSELNDENLISAIQNKEILSITAAVQKFGIKQVSRYRTLIQTLIEENVSNVESYYRILITQYRQRLSELITINEMQQYVLNDYDSYFTENGFIKKNKRLC